MFEVSLGVLVALAALALNNWRMGLMLCVLTAILQDPLRKLTPGEPAYFVLFVGVTFAAGALGALLAGKRLVPNAIKGWKSHLGQPFTLFLLLVVLQAGHSYVRFGIPQMTAIGLMAYLAPIPAVVFAYQFALRAGLAGLRRWMWFYVAVAGAALTGVYLEYLGLDWAALGEVGAGLTIYDVGTVLKAYSGFYRSSEIAAWHTSAIACFLFILLIGRRLTLPRLFIALALIGLIASLGVLTGRRKLLVVITVFLSSYVFLLAWFRNRATRPAIFAAAAGLLGYIAVVGVMAPDGVEPSSKRMKLDPNERYAHYTVRSSSVLEDVPKRVDNLGAGSVMWAVGQYGLLGAGLGTGSQGVQHVREAASIDRGPAEGGLGKITMELGAPGLVAVGWLLVAFVRYVRRLLAAVTELSRQHAGVAYGLVAFLIANAASFAVATQAFGDLFVLLIMGWAAGFLLALPVLAARDFAVRQQRVEQRKASLAIAPAAQP